MNLLTADRLQILSWCLIAVLGPLVGVLQRQGPSYWPAGRLLGVAIGMQGAYYLAYLPLFDGNLVALREWATASRAGLWLAGVEVVILCWALVIVLRVNYGRCGSSVDPLGHLGPPTAPMIHEAVGTLRHATDERVISTGDVRRLLAERAAPQKG